MKRATTAAAQRVCEAAGVQQAVVVMFDGRGQFAVASYGATSALRRAVRPTCNAIADAFARGRIVAPKCNHVTTPDLFGAKS